MTVQPPVLMVVTDPSVPDLEARVSDAVAGGAMWIQYRDKAATTEERVAWLVRFRERHPDAVVLVNDDLLAVAPGRANGLHMSQEYPSPSDARTLLSPATLIGRSVHEGDAEPEADHRPGLDYVTFGTVFASESHPSQPASGLHALARACIDTSAWGEAFTWTRIGKGGFRIHYSNPPEPLPVLAIGGVTAENAGDCIRAGATGVAVIRSVLMAKDPAWAAAEILRAMGSGA
jgi:thiamine-phosphate pyrophosphorylase